MRADMAKVIVERPRHGSGMRGPGKGYQRRYDRIPAEEQPRRERMRQDRHTKSFNEHLGPLRRYLRKQVGRPWDKVYAEICARVSRDTVVQKHVHTHIKDYVAEHVIDVEGVPHYMTDWGGLQPLLGPWRRPLLYVCPRTGLLKLSKQRSRRAQRRQFEPQPVVHVVVDYHISCVRQAGIWHWVRFEPFPKSVKRDALGFLVPVPDALQGSAISRSDAVRLYGRAVIAREVRRATRDEVRKHCQPLKAPNRV